VTLLTEQFAKLVAYINIYLTETQCSAFTVKGVSASLTPEDGALCIYFRIYYARNNLYLIQLLLDC
ncbi:hypothetical protein N310_00611, partial [Acanthisitta chloris]